MSVRGLVVAEGWGQVSRRGDEPATAYTNVLVLFVVDYDWL